MTQDAGQNGAVEASVTDWAALAQAFRQPPKLHVHNAADVPARQRVEHDDVVDAVQELGPEMAA